MLVSVLITNYNYGKYIRSAVESICEQTHKNIELIIVDDGSTDNSVDVINDIKGELPSFISFRLVRLKANAGKLAAISEAFPFVTGEFTILLDSDDFLQPDYIEKSLYHFFAKQAENPKIGFVYSDCLLVDESGSVISRGRSSEFSKEKILVHSFIPECGLTRSSLIREAMPFDHAIRVGTKHHKWKKIISNGWDGHYIPEPMFYYRMHGNNLSGIGRKIMDDAQSEDGYKEKILSGLWPLEK